jgi:hypothetical protein
VLGLLGFYDELNRSPGQPNGSLRAAVRPTGEPDEAALVSYLDAGHVLLDVMEHGCDALTGSAHRHSAGCSSLLTDGAWLWRKDFPHYVETHHVALPEAFTGRVRGLGHQMPALVAADFDRQADDALAAVGWASLVPWASPAPVLEPTAPAVMSKAEFDAEQRRSHPGRRRDKPRKPRRA